MKLRWVVVVGLGLIAACGSSQHDNGFGGGSSGGGSGGGSGSGGSDGGNGADGTLVQGDGSVVSGDGSTPHSCNPTSLDLEGCSCTPLGGTHACYTGPAKTRNVGLCKDGMQTCAGTTEYPQWGKCTGSVTPAPPICDGTVDADCSGFIGCNDPICASTPVCNMGCTTGQTRACYNGPAGTENIGICKAGMQTCSNNTWGACTGEVDPAPWNPSFCCDAVDHECTGVVGCFNLFQCIIASCCQSSCDAGGGLDPGCVCITGSGDTATCPKGDTYVHKGGLPGTDECCPCTQTDCNGGAENCCGESICAGNSGCSGYTCNPLSSSCNGQVSADCDDFPEDCDEPCCECTDGTC